MNDSTSQLARTVDPPSTQELDAARLILARMGIRAEDLLAPPAPDGPSVGGRAPVPTFADYVPVVAGAVSDGTRRVYGTYWKRLLEHWADRRIDEPTPSQIQQLSSQLRAQRVVRRNGRGGQLTGEHFIAALRCLTGTPSPTAWSTTTRQPGWTSPAARSPPAKPWADHDWPRSTKSWPAPATTRSWTPS